MILDKNGNKKRTNISNGETITIKEKKGEIIVDSDLFNNNKIYSEKINEQLIQMFKGLN